MRKRPGLVDLFDKVWWKNWQIHQGWKLVNINIDDTILDGDEPGPDEGKLERNVLQEAFCLGYLSPKVFPFLAQIMISVPVSKHSSSQEIAKDLNIIN